MNYQNRASRCVTESLDRRLMFVDVSANWGYVSRTYAAGDQMTGVFQLTTHSAAGVPSSTPIGINIRLSKDKVYGNEDDVLLAATEHFGGTTGRSTTAFIDDPSNAGELIEAGASVDQRLRLTIPADTAAGNYFVAVYADDTNELHEDNENNNLVFSSSANVKVLDSDAILRVSGGKKGDAITITGGGEITTDVNGEKNTYDIFRVAGIEVYGNAGADVITVIGKTPSVYVNGGSGDDKIQGGAGDDVLTGGDGRDQIFGGSGNDRLNGNASGDKLYGEGGDDRLFGYGGVDTLDGGSGDDEIFGGAGRDSIFGQAGSDLIIANDGEADFIFGGSGSDTVTGDDSDLLTDIESDGSAPGGGSF